MVAKDPEYAFLKDGNGEWVTRDDVFLYDAHPIHNNTEAPARPLRVATDVRIGPDADEMMGVDLMLGHQLGETYDEPVMILRFGVRHNIWFDRGNPDCR